MLALAGQQQLPSPRPILDLCMGLTSLQWWLLERQRPLPAGFCSGLI